MMHCQDCGNSLPSESRFCNHCGASLKSHLSSKGELQKAESFGKKDFPHYRKFVNTSASVNQVIFIARPSFFFIGISYLIAAIFSLLLSLVIGYIGLPISILLVLVFCLFLVPAYRHLHFAHTSYSLTQDRIEISTGLFSRSISHIPLRSIQGVFVNATFIERLLGIGDVLIDSASETGKIRLRQIRNPHNQINLILQQLSRW